MFSMAQLNALRGAEIERVVAWFAPGARILELGAGTGQQSREEIIKWILTLADGSGAGAEESAEEAVHNLKFEKRVATDAQGGDVPHRPDCDRNHEGHDHIETK